VQLFTTTYLYIMKARRDVYQAIADPTRRSIIGLIAGGPHDKKQGNQTMISWHAVFDSREDFIEVVKTYKADVGLKQNVEKMVAYLENLSK